MDSSTPTPTNLPVDRRALKAALDAVRRGYQVIALRPGSKAPLGSGWQHYRWPNGVNTTPQEIVDYFREKGEGFTSPLNLGVLLGEPSGGLVDVDLDHRQARRLKDMFLPHPTGISQHASKPSSHYWYEIEPGTGIPSLRKFSMPKQANGKPGDVIVELRSTGGQTVIPPSLWTDKDDPSNIEPIEWVTAPWHARNAAGPLVVNGKELSVQVALLALTSLLVEVWPGQGARHDAYLALAGGLLRLGEDVNPYWRTNAEVVIEALAVATGDEDGADARVRESIGSTIKALQDSGKTAVGWRRLSEIMTGPGMAGFGQNPVDVIRALVGEIESLGAVRPSVTASAASRLPGAPAQRDARASGPAAPAAPFTPPIDNADPNSPAAKAFAEAQARAAARAASGGSGEGSGDDGTPPTKNGPESGAGGSGDASAASTPEDAVESVSDEPVSDPFAGSWAVVDPRKVEDVITGRSLPATPEVLRRAAYANPDYDPSWKPGDPELKRDPQRPEVSLFYRGAVNMLYGSSESAKSWIALYAALEHIREAPGSHRALYIDLESSEQDTFDRLKRLGGSRDEISPQSNNFAYINPEQPLAGMQRGYRGADASTPVGLANDQLFDEVLDIFNPTLIIVDGMTVLYGLHGLDTNAAADTDVITTWLRGLARRRARPTVVVLDHVTKSADKGAMPQGSQHKMAMVQGTMLQAWTLVQPMDGALGEIELVVVKDRPGQVRKVSERPSGSSKAQVTAVVRLDAKSNPGFTSLTVEAPTTLQMQTGVGANIPVPGTGTSAAAQKTAQKAAQQAAQVQAIVAVFNNDATVQLTLTAIMKALGVIDSSGQPMGGEAISTVRARSARIVELAEQQGFLNVVYGTSGQGRTKLWELMSTV